MSALQLLAASALCSACGFQGCGQDPCAHTKHEAAKTDARTALGALVRAARKAVEANGGIRYLHEEDEAGEHACCGTDSYRPHADDCWVPLLGAALVPFGDVK